MDRNIGRNFRNAYKSAWISKKRSDERKILSSNERPKSTPVSVLSSSSDEEHDITAEVGPQQSEKLLDVVLANTSIRSELGQPSISTDESQYAEKSMCTQQKELDLLNLSESIGVGSISIDGSNSSLLETSASVNVAAELQEDLRSWAIENSTTHASIEHLLTILRKHGHSKLPKSARTLLHTPSLPVEKSVQSGMEYVYIGISNHLTAIISSLVEPSACHSVELAINVDGLPLFKSSSTSFWVILGRVINISSSSIQSVFPICITMGKTKPQDLDFLNDTIAELALLLDKGVKLGEKTYKVVLHHVVCDAPAKSLIKATKLYSGYSSCFDCLIKGAYVQHRMVFPEFENLQLRTDETFRLQQDKNHHTGDTPFCSLPIDMIASFPIDYMHSCLLGVTKKLLLTWCVETKGPSKLTAAHIKAIDKRLTFLTLQTPNDFARKPRSIAEVSRWKATEFRLFLLYTGKVVLQDILPSDKYIHFLAFSTAIVILVSPTLIETLRDFAHDLLRYFVSNCERLYGEQFLVYNIHSLLHLTQQTRTYGVLDNCAAFPFESYMQVIKKSLRHGNAPLAQAAKRMAEMQGARSTIPAKTTNHRTLSTKPPNNVYITQEEHPVELIKVTYEEIDSELVKHYLCRRYLQPKNAFDHPCASKIVGILKVNPSLTCFVKLTENQILASHKCYKMLSEEGCDHAIFQKIIHRG